MKRRVFLTQSAAAAAAASSGLALTPSAHAGGYEPSVLVAWNSVLLSAIATNSLGPTVAARAISMVTEAIYNAWVAYDWLAEFSLSGMRKRPWFEWQTWWKSIAVSHAAHTVLLDLFPAQAALFEQTLLTQLDDLPTWHYLGTAAMQTGKLAGRLLLDARHGDGSNQLGDLALGAYADWTGYQSVNGPDLVVDPTRWQPLRITTAAGVTSVQKYLSPHWGKVRPFALSSGSVFRAKLGNPAPSMAEMNQLINFSAGLTDYDKAVVDFFANNPGSVTPPGQWMQIAALVGARDKNTLDDDVRMFFSLGQAMLDASIACWDTKRTFDSVRPITAIRYYYRGQTIRSWGGPGLGTQWIRGEDWKPYQRPSNPTPPFPEFTSGHSTFSAAAAAVLSGLRGDAINLSFVFPARSVPFEPTVPAAPVTLSWPSLSAVAAAAGLSRRLGGIHFERGDFRGRAMGAKVGKVVLARCADLFNDGSCR